MKKIVLFSLVGLIGLGLSSCKKDDDNGGGSSGNDLPSGNFIKFDGQTWMETDFVSTNAGQAGNGQPFMTVYLNQAKTKFMQIQLDQVAAGTYAVKFNAAGSSDAKVIFAEDYSIPSQQYYPQDNFGGTLTIKTSGTDKVIEINCNLGNMDQVGKKLDARVIWQE